MVGNANNVEHFAHDPAGNLLAQSYNGQGRSYGKIKGNRLLMQGDCHFDYDAYGNLIRERRGAGQRLVRHYRYDSQHRLIGITLPDGSDVAYRYDAFGRRIAKDIDGKTTQFLWQGDRLIAENIYQKGVKGWPLYRSYVYEPGTFKPMALLKGHGTTNEVYYYQLDHLHPARTHRRGRQNRLVGVLPGGLNSYQYVPNPTGWVDPLGLMSVEGDCPDESVRTNIKSNVDKNKKANASSNFNNPKNGLTIQECSPHPSPIDQLEADYTLLPGTKIYRFGQPKEASFSL